VCIVCDLDAEVCVVCMSRCCSVYLVVVYLVVVCAYVCVCVVCAYLGVVVCADVCVLCMHK
jgi:hypothetical protein